MKKDLLAAAPFKLITDDDSFSLHVEGTNIWVSGKYSTPSEIIIVNCPKDLAAFYAAQPEVESVETEVEDIYNFFRVILTLKPGVNFFEIDHEALAEYCSAAEEKGVDT